MARRLLVLLFVLGLTTLASATKIQTSDPACNSGDTDIFNGQTITFNADSSGGGTFGFCNKTSSTWTTLLVAIETNISPDDILADPGNAFEGAQIYTTSTPDLVYVYFFGTCTNKPGKTCHPQKPGVLFDNEMTISLDCPTASACPAPQHWAPGTPGFGYPNIPPNSDGDPSTFPIPPVPEPATATLLITGLGAVYFKKRRRA